MKWATCCLLLGFALTMLAAPAESQAQGYTRLQVLLPGETAAPGTGTGKLGAPIDQVVGVPFTVRVRACDDQWNTISSITHAIALSSTNENAAFSGPSSLSGGEGQWTVTLNAAGSFTVSADDLTDPTIPLADSAFVTALLLQGFEFGRINQKNQYAGTPMSITVNAVDPSGDVVTGFSGTVQLTQLTSYGEGRIEPSAVNMVNGTWSGQVTNYRADQTAINRGNVNIYAWLPNDPTRNGTSDPFTVHPGPFSRVQLVVPGQNPAPGSVSGVLGHPASQGAGQAFTVSVFATDAYWNPLPSFDTVRITSSDTAASTPVTGALTDGFRQFTLSLGTVGTQTLTITDQTNGGIQGMTTAGIPVGNSNIERFVIEPIAGPVTAGQAVTVTIRATDVPGNTVPDYDGDAILTANTGAGSISPSDIVFTDGVWTGQVTFRGAGGSVSLSCSDFAAPPHTGTSAPFTVLAGPYTGLQVVLPGQSPAGGTDDGVNGNPNVQNSGTAFNVTIRAVDEYFNRVPGTGVSVTLSSSDPNLAAPETIDVVNGEAIVSVTLFAAGTHFLRAADPADGDITSHFSSFVQVDAGAYRRLVLLAPGQTLSPGAEEFRSGTATDQSINFAFTLTVHAADDWGNPVTGVSDVVRITSNDPLAQLPSDAALVDGEGSFAMRLATGGFQQITASNVSNAGILPSTTQVRAISSGLHLEAVVNPTSVQAGEPFTLTVKVTNDAGAVIQEINTDVEVSVRNASTQEEGRGTLLNTNFQLLQGQRSISQTYTFAESIVLVVRDTAGNTPAVTDVITVSPGTPTAIQLSANPSWVRGNRTATVTARLVDAFDNGVPARAMSFTVTAGQGQVTAIDEQTDADGIARAEFLAPRAPEMGGVRAVSGAVSADLDIETALVDPNAAGGLLTNYPNPFHPGEIPTTIAYKLDDDAHVRIRVFTLSGRLVLERELFAGNDGARAGLNEVAWDGRNGDGEIVASGGYLLVVEADAGGETLHSMRRKIGVVR